MLSCFHQHDCHFHKEGRGCCQLGEANGGVGPGSNHVADPCKWSEAAAKVQEELAQWREKVRERDDELGRRKEERW